MDLETKRMRIPEIAESHGARDVHVFGSVARSEDHPQSDIDLLVDMDAGRSLRLGQDLEQLLNRKIDVPTGASVHPALRERVLSEARPQ